VPSFQQAFGKFTDPMRTPAIWDLGPLLSIPEIFVGATPKSTPPGIFSTTFNTGDFCYQIMPDLLPLLLEMAQPEMTRATFAFDVDFLSDTISPPDFSATSFPLNGGRLHEVDSVVEVPSLSDDLSWIIVAQSDSVISENLFDVLRAINPVVPFDNQFERLQPRAILWHSYQEKKWHTEQLSGMETKPPINKPRPPFPIRPESETTTPAKPKIKKPTYWDLILPLLQPPLVFQDTENLFLPHDLYPYQPAGIEFLMNNESALLADEMGTGKTVMTVVALKILFQKNRTRRALIICPLSIVQQWNEEIEKWAPEFVAVPVRGTQNVRSAIWNTDAHVYLTTYDSIRTDIDQGILSSGKLSSFGVVVLDEAQNIKNSSSGRSKAIKKLNTRRRWALTGTPIENKIEDLASLFDFLRPGFLVPYDLYPQRIREKIKPYFLRRRKVDVLPDLPPKVKQDLWLELDADQRLEYDRVSSPLRSELMALGDRVNKTDIFSRIQRLKQICNFATGSLTSSKAGVLKEQVEQIITNGQKVIIFSQYISEGIRKLEQVLNAYGFAKLVGEQSPSVRDAEIRRFKESSDIPIFLASVKTGGVGLNLTEASYVIHFDHWWNPATMWQAEGRVHRIGQKAQQVNIYSYWTIDTIEQRIYQTLKNKGLLFEDIIDGLSESQVDELISTSEWLEMLDIKVKDKVAAPSRSDKMTSLSLEEIQQQLLSVSPSKFEHVAKELIRFLGYPYPKVVGKSGDGGIDIIASQNTENGIVHVAAQCKRYKGTVGASEARDFMGAIAVRKIAKGFLITTGDFSRECKSFCERSRMIVPISGLEMARYLKDFGISLE